MKVSRQQWIIAGCAFSLVALLFLFGRTAEKKKPIPVQDNQQAAFNITDFIAEAKQKLTPSQTIYLSKLENNITRGDLPAQLKEAYAQIAAFWRDSARLFEPFAWYNSQASKLDNSEKNLTFAARLFLGYLRHEPDSRKREWMADEAIKLFDKAIEKNPTADSLTVEKGACYVYGYASIGKAEKAMTGILMLRSIADKDSTNLQAQMLVGIGGVISGQYDKAINRLSKVAAAEPDNAEAISWLADAYAATGNKAEAVKWYNITKKLVNNIEYSKEIDQRIRDLK
jgi:tetratricopeptide (TPR) repeat protein